MISIVYHESFWRALPSLKAGHIESSSWLHPTDAVCSSEVSKGHEHLLVLQQSSVLQMVEIRAFQLVLIVRPMKIWFDMIIWQHIIKIYTIEPLTFTIHYGIKFPMRVQRTAFIRCRYIFPPHVCLMDECKACFLCWKQLNTWSGVKDQQFIYKITQSAISNWQCSEIAVSFK